MSTLFAAAFARFEPRPPTKSLEWFKENVSTSEGNPYDHGLFPHLGAPGGPCDALDDPRILTIWMQWGSRLGKTFFGQASTLFYADRFHCPMMFAGASEKLAVEVTERTCRMIEHCPRLNLVKKRQHQLDFKTCRVFVGWARSVSTLADKAVRLGHGAEIDKWQHEGVEQDTATEADPLKLFQDRGKEFPARKFIFESTPTRKGRSRIERGRLASTNCQYFVPCPHCKEYQRLRKDAVDGKGGIVWEHTDGGKSDKDLARRTAKYICEHCAAEIRDEHRAWMMRRGVWAPEGCGVDSGKALALFGVPHEWRGWAHADWITGEPTRNGRDAGYQLSSLHALQLCWGDIAEEFVKSKDIPQELRNFINQWLAETWETVKHKATWEQVGQRLISHEQRIGVVPLWASMVTVGIDKQGDDRYPWVVDAWGPERRSATIAYGQADSLDWLAEHVIRQAWTHADSRHPVVPCITLVDSGNRPAGVYEFVIQMQRQKVNVLACKGSSTALNADWRRSTLGKDTSLPGMEIYMVDTIRSQLWMDLVIHTIKPEESGGTSLFAGSLGEHQDFLEQIINDAAVESLDKSNNSRESWERINANIPNDFRDCRRYGYTAMLIATRGGPIHKRSWTPPPAPPEAPGRIRPMKIRGR